MCYENYQEPRKKYWVFGFTREQFVVACRDFKKKKTCLSSRTRSYLIKKKSALVFRDKN